VVEPGHEAWHYVWSRATMTASASSSARSVVLAGLVGPDVLIDQATFCDDLWQYRFGWAMIVTPWEVTLLCRPRDRRDRRHGVGRCQGALPGPGRFDNLEPTSNCERPSAFRRAGARRRTATVALPDLSQATPHGALGRDCSRPAGSGAWRSRREHWFRTHHCPTLLHGQHRRLRYEEITIEGGLVSDWEARRC